MEQRHYNELSKISDTLTQVRIELTETRADVNALIRGVVATREATVQKDATANARMTADEQRISNLEHKQGELGYQVKTIWATLGEIRERLKTVEVNGGVLKRFEWVPIAGLGYALVTHTPLADVIKLIR